MVYGAAKKSRPFLFRAVAVVAPSLQGDIFRSRGGGLQTAAFDLPPFPQCHPESRSPVLGERR